MLSLFLGRSVFTNSCLVRASNNGYSSTYGLKYSLKGGSIPIASVLQLASPQAGGLFTPTFQSSLHRLSLTLFFRPLYRTDLVAQIIFLITPRHGSRRHNTVHSRVTVSVGTCLPSISLAAAVYSCLLRICCLATDVASVLCFAAIF
jgi:hypothetical protein